MVPPLGAWDGKPRRGAIIVARGNAPGASGEPPMTLYRSAILVLLVFVSPLNASDPNALASRIDALLAARWTEAKVEPAPLADDGEFLRRVYLDITGRIPTPNDVQTFLAD